MEFAFPRHGYHDFHPAEQFVLTEADKAAFDRLFPLTLNDLDGELRLGPNMSRHDIAAAVFGLVKCALIGGGLSVDAANARAFSITQDVNEARDLARAILSEGA